MWDEVPRSKTFTAKETRSLAKVEEEMWYRVQWYFDKYHKPGSSKSREMGDHWSRQVASLSNAVGVFTKETELIQHVALTAYAERISWLIACLEMTTHQRTPVPLSEVPGEILNRGEMLKSIDDLYAELSKVEERPDRSIEGRETAMRKKSVEEPPYGRNDVQKLMWGLVEERGWLA